MKNVFGLIINGECIALRVWTEICQKIYGPVPQFHDFQVSSELVNKKYEIKPVKITWE
jgi:hypothetical protein